MLFHGFEKCRLNFRRSTIDLISKKDIGKYRTFSNFEFPCLGSIYLYSSEIRRKKIRGERYAFGVIPEYSCESLHRLGFPKTRNSLDQSMSSGKKCDYQFAYKVRLSDDILSDRLFESENDITSGAQMGVHK